MRLPERKELDQLSEEKIKMVYALADKMPDDQLRGQLKDQLRHRLKKIRPLRRVKAIRLFCLPFESLLSNDTQPPQHERDKNDGQEEPSKERAPGIVSA